MGKALERVREPVESNSVWIILGYHFAGYSRVVGPVAAGIFQIPYRRWAPLDYAGGIALGPRLHDRRRTPSAWPASSSATPRRWCDIVEIGIFAMFVRHRRGRVRALQPDCATRD